MSNKYKDLSDMELVLLYRKNNDKIAILTLCRRLDKECIYLASQIEKSNRYCIYSFDDLYIFAKESIFMCAKTISQDSELFVPYFKKSAKCYLISMIKKANKDSTISNRIVSLDSPISEEGKKLEFHEIIGNDDEPDMSDLLNAILEYLQRSKDFSILDKKIFRFYLQGFEKKEIAILCKCSLSNIYKSISETQEKVRQALIKKLF